MDWIGYFMHGYLIIFFVMWLWKKLFPEAFKKRVKVQHLLAWRWFKRGALVLGILLGVVVVIALGWFIIVLISHMTQGPRGYF